MPKFSCLESELCQKTIFNDEFPCYQTFFALRRLFYKNFGTIEHLFSLRHAFIRNVVERSIAVWISRFKFLQSAFPYVPYKIFSIVCVRCSLHYICIHNKSNTWSRNYRKLIVTYLLKQWYIRVILWISHSKDLIFSKSKISQILF